MMGRRAVSVAQPSPSMRGRALRETRFNPGCFLLPLLAVLILSGAWLYVNWKSSQTVLPPGLTINAIPMGGMTRDQALAAIAEAYTAPITVYYGSEVTLLLPEMVELTLDGVVTAQNLDAALETGSGLQNFLDYTLDQLLDREPEQLKVTAVVLYSRERLDAFMTRLAQRYDHAPQKPVALDSGDFRPASTGTTLDMDASRPLLVQAILAAAPEKRQVQLVVATEPAPEIPMELLRNAFLVALNDFDGVMGVFVKHLTLGKELCINCKAAFSGLSLLKIGVVLELYRRLDSPPDLQTAALISATLTANDHQAANQLLTQIGGGNPVNGAVEVTALFNSLGMANTYMAVPYDYTDAAAVTPVPTSANRRTDVFANPDPAMQTTPLEMGLLLEGLSQCVQGGGFLRVVYPQHITPAECQEILTYLEGQHTPALLNMELPPGVRVAHRHGWGSGTHADLNLVYKPEGNLVVVVFLYQPKWLVWEESAPTFARLGALVYRFFYGDD